jgi:hypothetical protein
MCIWKSRVHYEIQTKHISVHYIRRTFVANRNIYKVQISGNCFIHYYVTFGVGQIFMVILYWKNVYFFFVSFYNIRP